MPSFCANAPSISTSPKWPRYACFSQMISPASSCYPDRARPVRRVARHEEALACEHLALQPAREAARHLDLHGNVAGDERHRAGLGRQPLARLQRDNDCGRLPFADLCFHR
jgi:hypothetical protein